MIDIEINKLREKLGRLPEEMVEGYRELRRLIEIKNEMTLKEYVDGIGRKVLVEENGKPIDESNGNRKIKDCGIIITQCVW
jgi:hypothetical protein